MLGTHDTPLSFAGADPGFPVGGGANPPGGAPTYDFAKFRKKLHEIEKILSRKGGAHAGRAPLKSATALSNFFHSLAVLQQTFCQKNSGSATTLDPPMKCVTCVALEHGI